MQKPPVMIETRRKRNLVPLWVGLGVVAAYLVGYGILSIFTQSIAEASKTINAPRPTPATVQEDKTSYGSDMSSTGRLEIWGLGGSLYGWAEGDADSIVGEIKNNGFEEARSIFVVFDLISADNAKLGTASEFIDSLRVGETYRFSCPTWGVRYEHFRLGSIR